MERLKRALPGSFAAVGAALSLFFAASVAFAAAGSAPTNTSVLPLVIKAASVPALVGVNPLQLSAFACTGEERFAPVIFQIDEFDAEGHIRASSGATSAADESPGIIDKSDEIVLMLDDLGPECSKKQLREVRGRLVPVSAEASYLSRPGWVYFVIAERSARLSRRYVRYSSEEDQVSAEGYDIRYMKDNPLIADHFVSHDMRSLVGENILDRQKFRITARTLGDLLSIGITEEDIESTISAVRVGPVRIVREIHSEMTPVPGLTISADVTYLYYGRIWEIRVKVRLPQAAALFASSMDAVASLDYRDKLGIRLSTSAHPEGVLIDGKMLASERSLSLGDEFWYFETGEGINLVAVLTLEDDFPVVPRVHLIDGPTPANPPEDEPGGYPELGWELIGWEDLEAREYHFGILIAALPGFPERGGRGFYRVLQAPVHVSQGGKTDGTDAQQNTRSGSRVAGASGIGAPGARLQE